MPRRSLLVAILSIALISPSRLLGPCRAEDGYGWLASPGDCPDNPPSPCEVYQPQPGDIVFFSHDHLRSRLVYALAHTGKPYHVGLVVNLPDGRPAILEAGPYDYVHVYLMDLLPRLRTHEGLIWVRRLRVPLSPCESARLTSFALAQTGKRFALFRVILQATPFRAHGSLHSCVFGSSRIDRPSWFCSELVLAALAFVGRIDPHRIKPNAIFPRDLFRDDPFDLKPCWEAPRPWTCGPIGSRP